MSSTTVYVNVHSWSKDYHVEVCFKEVTVPTLKKEINFHFYLEGYPLKSIVWTNCNPNCTSTTVGKYRWQGLQDETVGQITFRDVNDPHLCLQEWNVDDVDSRTKERDGNLIRGSSVFVVCVKISFNPHFILLQNPVKSTPTTPPLGTKISD